MAEITYTTKAEEKKQWGEGPWNDEPDKVQWTDEETGLPCLAKRNDVGVWCGYVGVAKGHPWYEKKYDECDVEVHGGLSYSDHCQEGPEEYAICHIPEPGQPDDVWWLGFDTHHWGDLAPGMIVYHQEFTKRFPHLAYTRDERETYKTLGYVKEECRNLAKQIINIG